MIDKNHLYRTAFFHAAMQYVAILAYYPYNDQFKIRMSDNSIRFVPQAALTDFCL